MKPIFAIDISTDKKNEQWNSDSFIAASTKSNKQETLRQHLEEAEKSLDAAKLPLPLRIIRTVCGYLFLVILLGIIRALRDVGLQQGYQNAPWLFWLGGASLLTYAVLQILGQKRTNRVMGATDTRGLLRDIEQATDEIYRDLQVPQDAIDADILTFHYKIKKGNPVAKAVGFTTEYVNTEVKMFVKDGCFCIADNEHRYDFPLESFKRIRIVKKRITMPFWNKETDFDQEPYKRYNITANNMGMLLIKPYYVLELEHDGEAYGIYFPPYERPAFERLLNMSPEEAE
ncbi:MAG: hypothetical protein IJW49_10370 [Clostridia bacterium]|nr:hypothetical protein [Clostridia bacterium]